MTNGTFLQLLAAVAPVFLIVAAGWLLRRIAWIKAEADPSLLSLNYNFLYPCLIANTILGNPALDRADNLLLAPTLGFATVALGYIVAAGTARAAGLAWPQPARTFALAAGIYNYGFIPIPLVQAFGDQSTMGVLFVHNLGVEIALWSVGIWLLSGASSRDFWKKILNAPSIAIGASIALHLLGAHHWLPDWVREAMRMLGACSVPLALLLTGASLGDLAPAENRSHARHTIALGILVRLAVLPVLMLLIARWLPCSVELRTVLVIESAMPAAMAPIILAKMYGGDQPTAVRVVVPTTILGLISIPLWLKIGFWWIA